MPKSDVYSLGAILYNLLTGQPPYVEPGAHISPHTILARVLDGPPKRIYTLNSKAPADLAQFAKRPWPATSAIATQQASTSPKICKRSSTIAW